MPLLDTLTRRKFRDRLGHFLHPREHLTLPQQMKGREAQLRSMQDCFETRGAQAFIWGPRGVGKTSLGHTSCYAFSEDVELVGDVPCDRDLTFSDFLREIVRQAIEQGKVDLRSGAAKASFDLLGLSLSYTSDGKISEFEIRSTAHAAALLATIFGPEYYQGKQPVIIVDEFDTLQNEDTIRMLSGLIKQMSVQGSLLKLIFCGVARDLGELKVAHESVDRYIHAIELQPLSADAIFELITDVEREFEVSFTRGQQVRIAQISAGYPHFAHLILQNVLVKGHEAGFSGREIPADLFKQGVHLSAEQAATGLRRAYEIATRKGTDRYVEVLWAAANGAHLERQFKDVASDYRNIMRQRKGREELADDQQLRNHLNSLCKAPFGTVLRRRPPGWYEYTDPMFRSYVRMVAESEGIELGAESFRN